MLLLDSNDSQEGAKRATFVGSQALPGPPGNTCEVALFWTSQNLLFCLQSFLKKCLQSPTNEPRGYEAWVKGLNGLSLSNEGASDIAYDEAMWVGQSCPIPYIGLVERTKFETRHCTPRTW